MRSIARASPNCSAARSLSRFTAPSAMLRYRDLAVRLRVDGHYDEIATISTVAVANAQYFGGGMRDGARCVAR